MWVWYFYSAVGSVPVVVTTGCVVASDYYQSGPKKSGLYQGGPLKTDVYQSGPLKTDVYQSGPLKMDVYQGGSVAAQAGCLDE
jgi:hypothetical protein